MQPRSPLRPRLILATLAIVALACPCLHAAEHVTLRNGAELDCTRREPTGDPDRVRLYLLPTAQSSAVNSNINYIEVAAASILRVETFPDPPPPAVATAQPQQPAAGPFTLAGMRQMLDRASVLHNKVDPDLLASVIKAESNGNPQAVSRAGARGLMQLMPSTASELGVSNSFAPEQNIGGGTAYLDQLLFRYHDDIRLAVAAYNAGPAAVDRYHGIPPYAETRAYVARVISEFNRRKRAAAATLTAIAH
jgi:soluble lytic murein transglycosylase-like protein